MAFLDNNRSIETLTLQDCNCEEIFDVLSENTSSLKFFEISSSKIHICNLILIVSRNINLRHLNILNYEVHGESDTQADEFSGLLLEHFNLSRNTITKTFANFISVLICTNYKLQHLHLINCKMQESELIAITTLLKSLNHINYSNYIINYHDQVAASIARIIANNIYLEHVDISACCLTKESFSLIVKALKQLRILKYLNINSNYMTSDNNNIIRKFSSNLSDGQLNMNDMYDIISIANRPFASMSFSDEYLPTHLDHCNSSQQAPKLPCVDDYDRILTTSSETTPPYDDTTILKANNHQATCYHKNEDEIMND